MKLFSSLLSLFVSHSCLICGRRLMVGEECLCAKCIVKLPLAPSNYWGDSGNPVERIFYGQLPIVRASAYMRYLAGSDSNRAIHTLKYNGKSHAGRVFGRMMATAVRTRGFFDGIDALLPVPLSAKRERKRGYNQSQMLAEGVAELTGLPVITNAVKRTVDNPTQTGLRGHERKENVRDIFQLVNPDVLAGKHILLIDDVLTTGATLVSCGQEAAKAPNTRFSVLALAIAGMHGLGPQPDENKPASSSFTIAT